MLTHGPNEQTLARQAYRMGLPMPDFIANAPELHIGLQLYIDAFFDLDTERSHGMAITLIPWGSIRNYAEAYGFNEEQSEDLLFLIRRMDLAHTKKLAEKQKNAKKSK